MIISIHNNQMEVVDFMSNDIPGTLKYHDEEITAYLENGCISTFNLTVDCYKGEIYLSPDGATIGELSQGQRVIWSDILSLEPGKTPLEFTTSTWCKSPPEVEIEWEEHSL